MKKRIGIALCILLALLALKGISIAFWVMNQKDDVAFFLGAALALGDLVLTPYLFRLIVKRTFQGAAQ